jgi:hypothetical protein
MADRKNRKPQDIGSDSPASKSAKEQRIAGTRGGPRAGQQQPETEKQPPQTSGRRDPAHEHTASVRKGYDAAQDPESQGDGDPGPDQVREQSSQQGHGGHGATGRDAGKKAATDRP